MTLREGRRAMVRRSRLEIYFDVLEVINRGTHKPTRIMYKTNLSWTSLHEIFDTLLEGGFLQVDEQTKAKRYQITDKGKLALSYHLKSLEGLVEPAPTFLR
jgi:predicted transcriptional regulator